MNTSMLGDPIQIGAVCCQWKVSAGRVAWRSHESERASKSEWELKERVRDSKTRVSERGRDLREERGERKRGRGGGGGGVGV